MANAPLRIISSASPVSSRFAARWVIANVALCSPTFDRK
jgi:hypothetical protein